MNIKKYLLTGFLTFVFSFAIVTVVKDSFALPNNLLNGNKDSKIEFLGDNGELYDKMTCTLTYIGCDDATMQKSCNGYTDSTLNGNVCTYQLDDIPDNSCGASTKVCSTPEVTEQCYICNTENWIYHWGSSMPSSGSKGCSGSWNRSALTEKGCVSGSPPSDDDDDPVVTPKQSCYVCEADNKYVWDYNKPTSSCSSSWKVDSTITSSASCVAPKVEEPKESCYVCSNNSDVFYWGLKPNSGTNNCSSKWNLSNKPKPECVTEEKIENPNTGSFLLYVVYLIGILSLGYTGYYVIKNYKTINSK